MKTDWIGHCLKLSSEEADLYSGCRKIVRNRTLSFSLDEPNVLLKDAGYTQYKMTLLLKLYKNQESIDVAKQLWEKRKKQGKYGSVGFHCYNHLIKGAKTGTIEGKSGRASVMGPCIQSVIITLLDKKNAEIDIFYRTTELFKKFPADLVMIKDHLLSEFDFDGINVGMVNIHFANLSLHPMYFVTLLPNIPDPIKELDKIKAADRHYYDWIIKWTARYLIPKYHRGIAKFAQAQRVKKDALSRFKASELKAFQKYLEDNHPGYRNDYEEDDAED